jgi:hypothetical protein
MSNTKLYWLGLTSSFSKVCKCRISTLMDGTNWSKGEKPEVVTGDRHDAPAQDWHAAYAPQDNPDHNGDHRPRQTQGNEWSQEDNGANRCRKVQRRFHEALSPALVHPLYRALATAQSVDALNEMEEGICNSIAEAIKDQPE